MRVRAPNPQAYTQVIKEAMNKFQNKIQMLFVILPTNRLELYSSVKRQSYLEYGSKYYYIIDISIWQSES